MYIHQNKEREGKINNTSAFQHFRLKTLLSIKLNPFIPYSIAVIGEKLNDDESKNLENCGKLIFYEEYCLS